MGNLKHEPHSRHSPLWLTTPCRQGAGRTLIMFPWATAHKGPHPCAHVCGFWGNPPHPGRYGRGTVLAGPWSPSTSARHHPPGQVDPSSKRLIAVSVHFFCFLLLSWPVQFKPQCRPIAILFSDRYANPETCLPDLSVRPCWAFLLAPRWRLLGRLWMTARGPIRDGKKTGARR